MIDPETEALRRAAEAGRIKGDLRVLIIFRDAILETVADTKHFVNALILAEAKQDVIDPILDRIEDAELFLVELNGAIIRRQSEDDHSSQSP